MSRLFCVYNFSMWVPIKDALLQGLLPPRMTNFHMATMVEYFINLKQDMRAIKEESFQMFYRGHVQVNFNST